VIIPSSHGTKVVMMSIQACRLMKVNEVDLMLSLS